MSKQSAEKGQTGFEKVAELLFEHVKVVHIVTDFEPIAKRLLHQSVVAR
jgi:hypothetical protein